MPTISIFIRKEDLHRWKVLKDKSQWLHDNLPTTNHAPAQPVPTPQNNFDITRDPWIYEGLDLHNYTWRQKNGVVYEVGESPEPYEMADEGMVSRLKALGQIWKY